MRRHGLLPVPEQKPARGVRYETGPTPEAKVSPRAKAAKPAEAKVGAKPEVLAAPKTEAPAGVKTPKKPKPVTPPPPKEEKPPAAEAKPAEAPQKYKGGQQLVEADPTELSSVQLDTGVSTEALYRAGATFNEHHATFASRAVAPNGQVWERAKPQPLDASSQTATWRRAKPQEPPRPLVKEQPTQPAPAPAAKEPSPRTPKARLPSAAEVEAAPGPAPSQYPTGVGPRVPGLSTEHVEAPPPKPGEPYRFASPEVETRYQAAKPPGAGRPNIFQRIADSARHIRNIATRTYEHLPRGAKYAEVQEGLRRLRVGRPIAGGKAAQRLQEIILPFRGKPEKYDLFTRKVILEDAAEGTPSGKFPFKLESAEQVQWELTRLNAHLEAQHRDVLAQFERRKMEWGEVRDAYIEAMQDIGFDPTAHLSRENYYRHQIILHAQAKAVAGTGGGTKVPKGRGFLRRRKGGELDYSTNYVETEWEVMSQMIHDTQIAKFLKQVETSEHNIAPRLKAEARKQSQQLLENMEAPEAGELAEGVRVRALDRDNLGTIREVHDDSASVHFLNRETGAEATVELPISQLRTLSQQRTARVDWHTLIPEDTHTTFQPQEGNRLYLADTIPERYMKQAMEQNLEAVGVPLTQIRKALAVGGKFREMALPNELVATLKGDKTWGVRGGGWYFRGIRGWKQYQLINPKRIVNYNLRNTTGDLEAVIRGNPKGLRQLAPATRELYDSFTGTKPAEGDLALWQERGGSQGLLQAQEMGDINQLPRRIVEKPKGVDSLKDGWRKYWQGARLATDFRESILRYATFKDYLQQVRSNSEGRPNNFGASIPEEVMALKDPVDRAYKLSNELLGAYDQVTAFGQWLRNYGIPFWSWQEINIGRELRLLRNVGAEQGGKGVARAAGIKAGTQGAKWALGLAAALGTTQVYNHTVYPEIEAALDAEQRARPHIIMPGSTVENPRILWRVGAVSDLLEWAALDDAPNDVKMVLNGHKSYREWLRETALAPAAKVLESSGPQFKYGYEATSGRAMWPNVFDRRPIRDVPEQIARGLSVGEEVTALTGRPQRESYVTGVLSRIVGSPVDTTESAYWEVFEMKRRFQENVLDRQASPFGGDTPRSKALWMLKRALRYGDDDAIKKYAKEYAARRV
jgi:hypothetical protein